ncbi:hypothetical protein E150_03690 [Chlamydia trachomatis E/150]|nr:hypothetical protein E150_03690 [Chlamydia trachomatis E/150]AGR95985.1 hypothetical protein CTRC852_03750 [Chlamydia trachomatis RC-F(s)/852]
MQKILIILNLEFRPPFKQKKSPDKQGFSLTKNAYADI